jgi:hypothetical protein
MICSTTQPARTMQPITARKTATPWISASMTGALGRLDL